MTNWLRELFAAGEVYGLWILMGYAWVGLTVALLLSVLCRRVVVLVMYVFATELQDIGCELGHRFPAWVQRMCLCRLWLMSHRQVDESVIIAVEEATRTMSDAGEKQEVIAGAFGGWVAAGYLRQSPEMRRKMIYTMRDLLSDPEYVLAREEERPAEIGTPGSE